MEALIFLPTWLRIRSLKINQNTGLIIRTLLLVVLSACSGFNPSDKPQRLRITVGEIKEIILANRQDSAVELTGSSENKEIVEVSNQQLTSSDAAPTKTAQAGRTVFLIKGITTGTAKVVLAEKGRQEAGPGRTRKIYQVEVVNK